MSDTTGIAKLRRWMRADPRRLDVTVAVFTLGVGTLLILIAPDRFDSGWPEWAAAVGAFFLLLFRRSAPFTLLVVALAWAAVHVAVWQRPTILFFVVLVLLGTACIRLDRWRAIALGVPVAASLYLVGLIINDAEAGDARAIIGIAWTAVAVGIADAVRSWRDYRESADAQIRSAVLTAEAQAQQQVAEERLIIARELHDLLAHNLSVMNVQTGAALHLLRSNPDQAEQSLTVARDAGRSVLDELQGVLAVLRQDDGAELRTSSLPSVDELDTLVDTMRAAGLEITWHRSGAPQPLAPAVSLAAYRISQEALTNAAKHGAGSAVFTTEWDPNGLRLAISNETRSGTDAMAPGGHGVIGMNERATAIGGRFEAEHADGRFTVEAWLPVAVDRDGNA